ncbi:hypothetical protein PAXRUDRAFT_821919 [Paxillus rubicundulus Ve08.2h10]|uniref:Uncharacterized protein n=1 Tax=Paxillus rubicundulus Ve08.2h10 TaxID=930991 RepID=A0A0D0DXC9_9AGAM|nr:hypothetical protein PAXRUDRAFT_821919 [Paxillus rubicundulus Ve08.2h10]
MSILKRTSLGKAYHGLAGRPAGPASNGTRTCASNGQGRHKTYPEIWGRTPRWVARI